MNSETHSLAWRNRTVVSLIVAFVLLLLCVWIYLQWSNSKTTIARLEGEIIEISQNNIKEINKAKIINHINQLRSTLQNLVEHSQYAASGNLVFFNSIEFDTHNFENISMQLKEVPAENNFKVIIQNIDSYWSKKSKQIQIIKKGRGTIILLQEKLQRFTYLSQKLFFSNEILFNSLKKTKITKLKSSLIKAKKIANKLQQHSDQMSGNNADANLVNDYSMTLKLYRKEFKIVNKYRAKMHLKDRKVLNTIRRTIKKLKKLSTVIKGYNDTYLTIANTSKSLDSFSSDFEKILAPVNLAAEGKSP